MCENIEQSVLGYKDISKLNIVVDQSLIHRSWGVNRDILQGDAQTIVRQSEAMRSNPTQSDKTHSDPMQSNATHDNPSLSDISNKRTVHDATQETPHEKVLTLQQRDIANINATIYESDSPKKKTSDGFVISMLCDSGATVSLLSEDVLSRSKMEFEELPCHVSIRSFTNNQINVTRRIRSYLNFGNGLKHACEFYVFHGEANYQAILGWDSISCLKISIYAADNFFTIDGTSHNLIRYDQISQINNIEATERPVN